ncbi:MAG: N-glycosylase/DNA lyase [Candidatus Omnitrophica bacterium]|nr:N-glycosylase/DNA lyase [Candidatus Omnitrophota bacterium]
MKNFLPFPVPRPRSQEDISPKELIAHYNKIKPEIKRRIAEFRSIIKSGSEQDIFAELCFCILTANANAVKCHEAIKELSGCDLLAGAPACRIRPKLKGRARFHNKKADYIVGVRKTFIDPGGLGGLCIKAKLDKKDIIGTRDWLVNSIKGYGYKEASHFLRNIGLGSDIAILDRHVLKNLKRYSVIDKIPASMGPRKVYIEIEEKMRSFSRDIGIPMDELDLLFWSMQTGFIFK